MTDLESRFDDYEDRFDPIYNDRRARRRRKPKPRHVPKKRAGEIITAVTDSTEGLEGGFTPTYQPSQYETGWLMESLEQFYDQQIITDVLALVKGGKEASVYRCAAHPTTGVELVAAKVYRPRMFRQLRNDKRYRQGRSILTAEGRPVKKTDHRVMRAIGKKSAFGVQVAHTSWLMHEYTTLQQLYRTGGAVPQPFAVSDNVIIMGYVGDERMAAPLLNDVRLSADEVRPLFDEVLRNVELMLGQGWIHGDLSAYNILYWDGAITLIDFPQVTALQTNPDAYGILRRDIARICEYFARMGLSRDADALADDLWYRYGGEWFDPMFLT